MLSIILIPFQYCTQSTNCNFKARGNKKVYILKIGQNITIADGTRVYLRDPKNLPENS